MKRSVKMIGLLGVATVFLGVYFIAGNLTKKASTTEEAGTFPLTDKEASAVTGIAWNANDTDYSFTRGDDGWSMDGNADFPVNDAKLDEMAETIVSLTGSQKLENIEKPEDYGLAEPAFTVKVNWDDDTETTYAVGDATAFEDGYYLSDGEDGVAYIVSESPQDSFSASTLELAQQEEIPQIDDVTHLTLGSVLHADYRDESTSIDPDAHWYASESGAELNADGVTELISQVQQLAWQDLIAVGATDDELSGYGLDAANITNVGISNDAGDAMELWIGATDENGNYYARLPDSGMVYTVAPDIIGTLINVSEADVKSTALMNVDPEQLTEAELVSDGNTYAFECATAAGDDTESDAESDSADTDSTDTLSVTLNGESTDAEAFRALWSQVSALFYSEKVDALTDADPLLTVTAENTDGVRRTISFYPYDADNYLAIDSDGNTVLVSADGIDRIRRTLAQY